MAKLAERRLNALGNLNAHSCFVNDIAALDKMRNQVQIFALISQINHIQQAEAMTKKTEEDAQKVKPAPATINNPTKTW